MSAEIIPLGITWVSREDLERIKRGNGARGALINHAMDMAGATLEDAESWADFMLAALWSRGFRMVPVE